MQRQRNNQEWASKIRSTQIPKHLAFFALGILSWLGFSYLFTLFIKIPMGRSVYDFPWHWDAPVWNFGFCIIGALLIVFAKRTFNLLTEKSKNISLNFIVLTCFIPVNALVINAFSILILDATYSGKKRPVEFDWVMGFLHQFISQTFVAMTCIGYFYLTLVNKTKEKLLAAQQAKTAMELRTLQKNIEPHFLFNNLNVLSSLIESNPRKANDFLTRLAELYRYILQTQTFEVVPLRDELQFAESYVYLLRERFGEAYDFHWEIPKNKLDGQMIVPGTLQTLIENTVKHNAGSNQKPLRIAIKLGEDFIAVENEARAKPQTGASPRTGLQNLATRYAFLTDKPVEIVSNGHAFSVKLPLIQNK